MPSMSYRRANGSPRESKICPACGRSFDWRRKWAAVWAEVRYCSDACRSGRYAAAKAAAQKPRRKP